MLYPFLLNEMVQITIIGIVVTNKGLLDTMAYKGL